MVIGSFRLLIPSIISLLPLYLFSLVNRCTVRMRLESYSPALKVQTRCKDNVQNCVMLITTLFARFAPCLWNLLESQQNNTSHLWKPTYAYHTLACMCSRSHIFYMFRLQHNPPLHTDRHKNRSRTPSSTKTNTWKMHLYSILWWFWALAHCFVLHWKMKCLIESE